MLTGNGKVGDDCSPHNAGCIITTGTPPGVGMGQHPPLYLNEVDVIELGIEKLGAKRNTIGAWNSGS